MQFQPCLGEYRPIIAYSCTVASPNGPALRGLPFGESEDDSKAARRLDVGVLLRNGLPFAFAFVGVDLCMIGDPCDGEL